jgi:hypothetical protein
MALVCICVVCAIWGTTSDAVAKGMTVPLASFPVVAPSQRWLLAQNWPSTLSKLWFSWYRTTTCLMGLAGVTAAPRCRTGAAVCAGAPVAWAANASPTTAATAVERGISCEKRM